MISLLAVTGVLGWSVGTEKVAKIEDFATSLNLAVIIGFLVARAA